MSKLNAGGHYLLCNRIFHSQNNNKKYNAKNVPQTRKNYMCAMVFYLDLNEIKCLANVLELFCLLFSSTKKEFCNKYESHEFECSAEHLLMPSVEACMKRMRAKNKNCVRSAKKMDATACGRDSSKR